MELRASNVARLSSLLLFFFILHTSARNNNPLPNPDSVIQIDKARFTILTSHLIRIEWGSRVDAATFVFVNRNLPKPDFTVSTDQGWHVIQTSAVKVRKNMLRCFIFILRTFFAYAPWSCKRAYVFIVQILFNFLHTYSSLRSMSTFCYHVNTFWLSTSVAMKVVK